MVSGGTVIFVQFQSVSEYLSVSLLTGSQLLVNHYANNETVIDSIAKMKLNDAEWHKLNIEFSTEYVSVVLHHDDCSDGTACSSRIPIDGLPAVAYFGSAAEGMHIYEGFVGCMRDIRVNSDWLTPSWLAAVHDSSVNVSGSCDWSSNCEPDPCNGRGMCTDLWTHPACDCRSPFWGLTCSRGICAYIVV